MNIFTLFVIQGEDMMMNCANAHCLQLGVVLPEVHNQLWSCPFYAQRGDLLHTLKRLFSEGK